MVALYYNVYTDVNHLIKYKLINDMVLHGKNNIGSCII